MDDEYEEEKSIYEWLAAYEVALEGSPLEKQKDIEFLEALHIVVNYLKDNESDMLH